MTPLEPYYLWGEFPAFDVALSDGGEMSVSGERPEEWAKIPYPLADSLRRSVEWNSRYVDTDPDGGLRTDGGTDGDGTERLVIGWTCDDCDRAVGDEPRMWDLAERLREEHEEESGHTTTVEVVEESRILPSQVDRMEIGESMLDLAETRSNRIEWICPECQRTGEQLDTNKRCPDCDERFREVLPDGGES
jgi:hypothetical protein